MQILVYFLYLLVWMLVCLFSWSFWRYRAGRILGILAYIMFLILLSEMTCVLGLKYTKGEWTFLPNENRELFQRHPYLVARPKPDVEKTFFGTTIQHNHAGFRGGDIKPKSSDTRVAAVGGSTTYGVGVNNEQTWPHLLEGKLGTGWEVLNFAVPGHSTVENLILTAFILPDYQPDMILVHAGLNDMHIMNSPGLEPDYSNIHAPMMIGNLGLCYSNQIPAFGFLRVFVLLLERLSLYPTCEWDKLPKAEIVSGHPDSRALELYKRNLSNLILLGRKMGSKVFLVPQVLIQEVVADGGYQWWTPHIEQKTLVRHMEEYNLAMEKVALKEGAGYIGQVLEHDWRREDFKDHSHLNAKGNEIFAGLIANQLSAMKRERQLEQRAAETE